MKKSIVFTILTVFFILIMSLSAVGYFVSNTSVYIFSKSIENTIDNVIPNIKNSQKYLFPINNPKLDKWHLNINSINDDRENNITIKSKSDIYYDNETFYTNTHISNNKETLNFEVLSKDDKLYFKLNNILNNFYYFQNIKNDESTYNKKAINYLKTSISEEITNDDFTKTKEILTLNGVNYKTTKVTLNLTEKLLYKICINFLNKYKNDEAMLSYNSKKEGISKEENINKINNAIENAKKNGKLSSNKNILYYSIYVNNNDTLKHEIKIDKVSYSIENHYVDNEERTNFFIASDEITLIKLETITTNSNVNISGNFNESLIFDGKINRKANSVDANINIKNASSTTNIGNINYHYEFKNNEGNILLESNNSNKNKLTINGKITTNDKMPNIDVSKSVNVSNMSEEEKQLLITKIFTIIINSLN